MLEPGSDRVVILVDVDIIVSVVSTLSGLPGWRNRGVVIVIVEEEAVNVELKIRKALAG